MLVTNKEEQKMCMEEIVGCKNPMLFGINAEKKLVLQNHWTSDLYLAYFGGNWYASNGEKQGGSKYRKLDPHLFFAYGDGLYLEPKGKGKMEASASNIKLSEDTHSFLLFYQNKILGIVVADGSKSDTVFTEEFEATHCLWKMFLMSICAMIRQHNSEAANEIEEFWNTNDEAPAFSRHKK